MIISKPGLPLNQTDLVDKRHLSKLRAFSITTVEELISLAQDPPFPNFVEKFLEGTNVASLLNSAMPMAALSISDTELGGLREITYAFGSLPPAEELAQQTPAEYD